MNEQGLGNISIFLCLLLFRTTPAYPAEEHVSNKNGRSATSLRKSEVKLAEKLQSEQLDPNTTADLLYTLARTSWLLGDRPPTFDRFEQNQDWFKKAAPIKAFNAELAMARLEVDHDRYKAANELLESIDRMEAPPGIQRSKKCEMYARHSTVDTLAAMPDANQDVVKKLADATNLVNQVGVSQEVIPDYLLAAAKVCQRQKMKTLAAAFARESARLSFDYSNGHPGEPYCRTLDLLAELDDANDDPSAASNDRLSSFDYSSVFHGKESPLTQTRAQALKKAQAKVEDLQRNPPVKDDDPSIRLRGVPSWELTLGRGAGRQILGDRRGAETLYQESLKGADEAGFTAGRAERPLDALAGLCNEEERFPEAENYARRALELCDKRKSEPEEYRAATLEDLFHALWGQGKFTEARTIAARLKKMVTDGKLQRGEAAQVLMFAGMTERLFGEETAANDDLNAALRLSEIDPKSVWIPKYYLLWQSAAVLDQTNNSATALALMKEAKRLFSARDKSISDRQRARFYAAIARREYCRDDKDQIRDWTEAVRFAKIGYGPQDCHTKNDIGYLKMAQSNYRNRHKMKGGIFLPSPCDNVDEPEALVRPAEH